MKSLKHVDPADLGLFFKGRPGDSRLGEWARRATDENRGSLLDRKPGLETLSLFGSPDDLGVVLNLGRAGAKEGPDSIRKHLYKMAMPMDFAWEDRIRLVDFGNTSPTAEIEVTHERSRAACQEIAHSGATLIALGGGHDFAAPHLLGFIAGRRNVMSRNYRIALVNIDPHLDVRELENEKPHSGTPFRQILESGEVKGKSFVELGARSNRNARAHYEYCRSQGVAVMTLESLRSNGVPPGHVLEGLLKRQARTHSELAVTFDMDACCDAEGTSAAPVLGFRADEMVAMAEVAGRQPKVKYFEIAEVAPPLESTERSSRIAAEMIFRFAYGRASCFPPKKSRAKARGSARL